MTAEKIKQDFKKRGITFTQWAQNNGYPVAQVYRVLNGQAKCNYGDVHEIAVKLGMKEVA